MFSVLLQPFLFASEEHRQRQRPKVGVVALIGAAKRRSFALVSEGVLWTGLVAKKTNPLVEVVIFSCCVVA